MKNKKYQRKNKGEKKNYYIIDVSSKIIYVIFKDID